MARPASAARCTEWASELQLRGERARVSDAVPCRTHLHSSNCGACLCPPCCDTLLSPRADHPVDAASRSSGLQLHRLLVSRGRRLVSLRASRAILLTAAALCGVHAVCDVSPN